MVSDGKRAEMTSPQIESPAAARIRPIYPRTEGLTARMIETNVAAALDIAAKAGVEEILPDDMVAREGLCDRLTAIRQIHFPPDHRAVEEARRRLIFEELFVLQLGLLRLKSRSRRLNGAILRGDYTAAYVAGLPFAPTGAQRRAIADCIRDMQGVCPMSRLVQGDVGSGKTLVAAAGMVLAAQALGWLQRCRGITLQAVSPEMKAAAKPVAHPMLIAGYIVAVLGGLLQMETYFIGPVIWKLSETVL